MLGVAGCKTTQPLTEYEPVVDTYNVDMVAFESDLLECRNIGLRVQAEYERKNKKEWEEIWILKNLDGMTMCYIGYKTNILEIIHLELN